jgi:hypothetical protein
LFEQLQSASIDLDTWYREMRTLVKDVHLYSATLARGGWAQMNAADYGRVGGVVANQYKFLDRFVRQLILGEAKLDGRSAQRVRLYMLAGRITHDLTTLREMRLAGMTQERSVLGDAEHCRECLLEAEKGWGPIGHTKPIGQRSCLGNCQCYKQYR